VTALTKAKLQKHTLFFLLLLHKLLLPLPMNQTCCRCIMFQAQHESGKKVGSQRQFSSIILFS
jgi:hypothetical protein